jgi:integrase
MMSTTAKPRGHLQVKGDKNGRGRSFYAYWWDAEGKHGRCLGPAHVRDSGRRTPRGAVVWRAGDGPRPSAEHLTPMDAEARLEEILEDAKHRAQAAHARQAEGSLREAVEGWVAERQAKKRLKRSTVACYEDMFERLCRDLGADTPVRDLADGRLEPYFAGLKAECALGAETAEKALIAGKDVVEVRIESWTARPPGSQAVEVSTKAEAVRLASEMCGTWKHRRQGVYRVVPTGAVRARRVSRATAQTLRSEGWPVSPRTTKRWVARAPASVQTHNKYRDLLGAALDYAVRQGWLEANPIADIDRMSGKATRRRILRRDDFYNRDEVECLLKRVATVFEEAFLLCGAHAGFRLPGEALGLRWGTVDFQVGVIRPYDNWVQNAAEDTKTSEFAPIPMTPRLTGALAEVKRRGFATGDGDFVFASDRGDSPVSGKGMRDVFKLAQREAELAPIPMYNLRHSFGTTLASSGVDVRTIQALMRHDRLTTTEQYLAYSPQPDLADQITRALDPDSPPRDVSAIRLTDDAAPTFLERLEEEIPAKWVREVQRLYAETGAPLSE